jgi:hypothetical protein
MTLWFSDFQGFYSFGSLAVFWFRGSSCGLENLTQGHRCLQHNISTQEDSPNFEL